MAAGYSQKSYEREKILVFAESYSGTEIFVVKGDSEVDGGLTVDGSLTVDVWDSWLPLTVSCPSQCPLATQPVSAFDFGLVAYSFSAADFKAFVAFSSDFPNFNASCCVIIFFFLSLDASAAWKIN